MKTRVRGAGNIGGRILVPGDKSISHRALMFGALASGETLIRNFLDGEDCRSTARCLGDLGVSINNSDGQVHVRGAGGRFSRPGNDLDCGNSGTTMRIMAGMLAGRPLHVILTGDDSLIKRPMKRVIEPLRMMGADIHGRDGDTLPPLVISGRPLTPISYVLPVASAQVKSCIIMAALCADGETIIEEPGVSRDHTERMLSFFGGEIGRTGNRLAVRGLQELSGRDIVVPGDFSSAAFFIGLAAMTPGASLTIHGIGLNPTRTGFLDVLSRMGAEFVLSGQAVVSGEPVGTIEVRGAHRLFATDIGPSEVPLVIDEIPLIAVLLALSDGTGVISGARELRFKESDRIAAMTRELARMGADVRETDDGMAIRGIPSLKGAAVDSWNDHRVAMSLMIAGCRASGDTIVDGAECVGISFPEFPRLLASVGGSIEIQESG